MPICSLSQFPVCASHRLLYNISFVDRRPFAISLSLVRTSVSLVLLLEESKLRRGAWRWGTDLTPWSSSAKEMGAQFTVERWPYSFIHSACIDCRSRWARCCAGDGFPLGTKRRLTPTLWKSDRWRSPSIRDRQIDCEGHRSTKLESGSTGSDGSRRS